jgi:superfamily I DNA and/or RNA helicase
MNAEISEFSRNEFYNGEALKDANTISERNRNYPFGYRQGGKRSVWLDVPSTINSGVNSNEIMAIKKILQEFIEWARQNPPPKDNPNRDDKERWEVALLSPYQAQRRGLRDMVRSLTRMQYETRFDLMEMERPSNVMLVVNSSDRFQGQEADVVFLSLRNGSRIGFLDSPSRMNVAITRSRELRIIVGNHSYFSGERCYDPMLRNLAKSHKGNSIESARRK